MPFHPFDGCISLSEITVDKQNPVYDSRDNCNAIIKTESNKLIVGSAGTHIPNTVTSIKTDAFTHCMELREILIPDSVIKIGYRAFSGCISLEKISLSEFLEEIEDYAFTNCKSLIEITLPKSIKAIGESAFMKCENLRTVTIISQINFKFDMFDIFDGCKNIKEIILGSGIKKFCNDFFSSFENTLESIYVPLGKVDYYKKRIPERLHKIIKELPMSK